VVVIHGEGLGRMLDIGSSTPVLIGRSNEADMVFSQRGVSRTHCQIWFDGATYRIRNLGDINPTRINDMPFKGELPLMDGDQITIGENILKFISQDSVEARYHEEIYLLATRDSLTELCNRRHFVDMADKEISRAVRRQQPLSLCVLDVDRFKSINDDHGHLVGDEVLRQMAGLLRQNARDDDLVGRMGGEEFALLLPECSLEQAAAFAERLREVVATAHFTVDDRSLQITVSIGVAALLPGRDTHHGLMAAADAALYRAKIEGRNRVCVDSGVSHDQGATMIERI
jgi:diguanylate cyclase (GGDEF)-like protein